MAEYVFLLPISLSLLLGVMSPGPSFLLVAQTAAAKSRSDGIATSLGMGVGAAAFAVAASAGLYVVLETVPLVYVSLKFVGGLYLCFLGYKIWRSANEPTQNEMPNHDHQSGMYRSFLLGLVTQLSNPKTALVFVSIFAAFLPANLPAYAYLYLCLLAFVIDASWYCLVSVALSTSTAQKAYTKYKLYICRTAGGFMGVLGLKLATNQ